MTHESWIPSPCRSICRLGPDDVCDGCGRTINEIVSWVRLLLAAELLRSPSQCVERVSNALEFASASAFRNLCRRHLGIRPTDLRTSAGRDLAYAAFTRAMHGQCEPARALADGACGERPAAHVETP